MEKQIPAVQRMPEDLWIQLAILLRDKFPCRHGRFMDTQSVACECRHRAGNIVSLATTSQFLRRLVHPLLYHRIDIDCFQIEHNILLMESLEKAPNLHARVHHLTIQHCRHDNPNPDNTHYIIARFLGQLHHLHHLEIKYSEISIDIVQLLQRSTHLRALEFIFTNWTEDGARFWAAGPQLGHSEFTFLQVFPGEGPGPMQDRIAASYAKFLVPTLREIYFSGPLGDNFSSVLPVTLLENVVRFRFDMIEWSVVQAFLTRSPNVEVVTIHNKGPIPSVFGTLTRLRSATGWPEFMEAISIERPGVVEQTWHSPVPMDICTMEIRNNELQKLCIIQAKWSPGTFQSLGQRCTQLKWLEIGGHGDEWKNVDLAAEVAGLSQLRVLLLTWQRLASDPHPETFTERRTLEEIKNRHCPHLHEAQISPERAWAYLDGWVPVLRDLNAI